MGVMAAGALLAGGAAEITAISFETIALISTAVSVVGAVTGSKTLMKLGAGGSLVGGIGSWLSPTTATEATAGAAADTAASGAAPDAAASGAASDASGVNGFTTPDAASSVPGAIAPGSTMPSGTNAAFGPTPTADVPAIGAAPAGNSIPGAMPTGTDAAFGASPITNGAIPKPGDLSSGGIASWFKGLPPDAQAKVASQAMQVGGGALSGMFQGWSEEQKLALEREKFNFQQQQYSTQVKNANSPAQINFANPGLIASAQKPTPGAAPVAPAAQGA